MRSELQRHEAEAARLAEEIADLKAKTEAREVRQHLHSSCYSFCSAPPVPRHKSTRTT